MAGKANPRGKTRPVDETMEDIMSIVRVEKECTIKCDFCWARIQPGTEYYVNMIGVGVDAEEEYRCQDCEEIRVKNMYGKLCPYA